MNNKTSPNLAKLIVTDLFTVGRLSLLLFILIGMTAMGVVFATQHARQAITEKDHTLTERARLDNEWRNLMLEETALSEYSRVQTLAKKKLGMRRPDADKEVVITLR